MRVALRMLERGEYDHIQMRDVAEEAEVALGTVYRYFASKEHLFAAVLVEWSQSLQHRVQGQPLHGGDVPTQLLDLMNRVIVSFERLPQFFRLMVVIETTADPYARALFRDFVGLTHDTFSQPLAPLQADDARAVLEVLTSVLGNVLRGWAIGQLDVTQVQERVQRAIALIFSPAPKARTRSTRMSA